MDGKSYNFFFKPFIKTEDPRNFFWDNEENWQVKIAAKKKHLKA